MISEVKQPQKKIYDCLVSCFHPFILITIGDADVEVDVRDTYERAIANIPLVAEKSYWRRYIYLCFNYVLFEEIEAGDVEKTRQVYESCLKLIPHRNFPFFQMWFAYAHFEVRQKKLQLANAPRYLMMKNLEFL